MKIFYMLARLEQACCRRKFTKDHVARFYSLFRVVWTRKFNRGDL